MGVDISGQQCGFIGPDKVRDEILEGFDDGVDAEGSELCGVVDDRVVALGGSWVWNGG